LYSLRKRTPTTQALAPQASAAGETAAKKETDA
jgi:hypothetical protein